MRLVRSLPELPVDLLLEVDEWQAAYILNNKAGPQNPQLSSGVQPIAWLGGFLCPQGDGGPEAKML